MKNPEIFEDLCGILEKSLANCVEELMRDNKERVSPQDAEYLNWLTHSVKSVKTTMAMEGYGDSERRGRNSMGRFVSRDGSYEGSYDGSYYDGGSHRSYEGSYDGSYDGRSMHGDREKVERMIRETKDLSVKRALKEAMRNM